MQLSAIVTYKLINLTPSFCYKQPSLKLAFMLSCVNAKLMTHTKGSESDVAGANLVMLGSSVLQAKLTQVRRFHWATDLVLFSYINGQENITRYLDIKLRHDNQAKGYVRHLHRLCSPPCMNTNRPGFKPDASNSNSKRQTK